MKTSWLKHLLNTFLWTVVFVLAWGVTAEWYLTREGYKVADEGSYKTDDTYDAYLGWKISPGMHQPVADAGLPEEHIWPDCSRASRPQQQKKATQRVLLVGCSHTYGLSVPDEDTFAWQLNERFPDVAFDNFGVNGYGTYQSYLREKQQLMLHPDRYDLVLYCAFVDHLSRNTEWKSLGHDITSKESFYLAPRVDYNYRGEMQFFGGDYRWPGDDKLVCVNFARRVFFYSLIRRCKVRFTQYDATKHCIFWELNRRMAEQAHRQGAKYGLVWLFNKNSWDYMLAQRRQWHDNYPWKHNPCLWEAEPEYPCLCIDVDQHTLEQYHLPNDNCHYDRHVHSIWAKNIGDWVERLLPQPKNARGEQ